jgi:hypothetical protein
MLSESYRNWDGQSTAFLKKLLSVYYFDMYRGVKRFLRNQHYKIRKNAYVPKPCYKNFFINYLERHDSYNNREQYKKQIQFISGSNYYKYYPAIAKLIENLTYDENNILQE